MDFYQKFKQKSQEISLKIGKVESSVLLNEVAELLEECRSRRETLPTRDVEGYERELGKLADQIRKKPKKFKFAFKPKAEPVVDAEPKKENKTQTQPETEKEGQIIGPASNINKCISIAQDPLKTLHLSNIKDSIVFLKEIQGPLYLEKVFNSTIVANCHQLRIHESESVRVYVGCRRPIIENCTAMQFAHLEGTTEIEGVDDFSWLRPEQSQNWKYTEPEPFDWIKDPASVQQKLTALSRPA